MITFDTIGTRSVASGSVISWAHTVATTNNNGILVVGFLANGTANATSVKYAGTAMTKIIAGTQVANINEAELWYLLNPPSGLGTINGTYSVNSLPEIDGMSVSYFGVDQVTPILGSARVLGTATNNGSVTRTLANVDSFWIGINGVDNVTGSTNIGNQRGTAGGGGELMFADSLGGTLRWANSNAASNWTLLGAEMAAAPRIGMRKLLGVGN